jgi:dTDP-4-dehydrorhamnose reductase
VSASPRVGAAAANLCETRGLSHHVVSREAEGALEPHFDTLGPWAVLCLPYAEDAPDLAAHLEGVRRMHGLGDLCAARGVPLLGFSSSLVFDGQRGPYLEGDPTAPACPLGAAFAEAEAQLLTPHPGALVVRTGPLFGPWSDGEPVLGGLSAHPDARVSPSYLPDALNAALDLLIDGEHGLWHLAPPERPLWSDLLGCLASPAARSEGHGERRAHAAADSSLQSERGGPLPPLADALRRWRSGRSLEAGAP